MPSYLIAIGLSSGYSIPLNLTRYSAPIGRLDITPTEICYQLIARDSYTLSNLYVYVSANTITDATTVRSRKQTPPGATGNGNQSVSIPASTTGAFTDAANTDSLVDGDLFCTQTITPNAGTSITITTFSYILSTANNTTPILATTCYLVVNANLTTYFAIAGSLVGTTTESSSYYTFRTASILSNLRCRISANTITAISTLQTKNGANNRNQSVSIPASTTGAFEDTTNTDSVAKGEDAHYQLTTGATGTSLTIYSIQMKSNSAARQVAVATLGTTTLAKALTRYLTIEGTSQSFNATEALVQVTARASFATKNMYVNISANSIDNGTTFRLRKNTGNSTLTVSVPATQTGQFEDITNTDSYVATDVLNWSVVTGGTTGTITIVCIGFELAQVGVEEELSVVTNYVIGNNDPLRPSIFGNSGPKLAMSSNRPTQNKDRNAIIGKKV